ncbi:hypothetical protein V5799_004870 [Amblyomma americanum]|uniref:Uncharacterized protein n=1 Tax=Amblyomma americanum TaxID=6943 RepID=A0AAQ4D4U8_AMBAM
MFVLCLRLHQCRVSGALRVCRACHTAGGHHDAAEASDHHDFDNHNDHYYYYHYDNHYNYHYHYNRHYYDHDHYYHDHYHDNYHDHNNHYHDHNNHHYYDHYHDHYYHDHYHHDYHDHNNHHHNYHYHHHDYYYHHYHYYKHYQASHHYNTSERYDEFTFLPPDKVCTFIFYESAYKGGQMPFVNKTPTPGRFPFHDNFYHFLLRQSLYLETVMGVSFSMDNGTLLADYPTPEFRSNLDFTWSRQIYQYGILSMRPPGTRRQDIINALTILKARASLL